MGERTTAVAIPESPNAGHIGSETIIHLNIAASIGCDSGLVQPEIVGVRPPSHGEEQMGTDHRARSLGTSELYSNIRSVTFDRNALRVDAHVNSFVFQNSGHRFRHVRVFARDQPWSQLNDRHFAAEPAIDLRKFQADIAPADDDEMAGQEGDIHHGTICQVIDLVEPRHRWHDSPAAHIDEHMLGG
jgi:hypothetical protein